MCESACMCLQELLGERGEKEVEGVSVGEGEGYQLKGKKGREQEVKKRELATHPSNMVACVPASLQSRTQQRTNRKNAGGSNWSCNPPADVGNQRKIFAWYDHASGT